MPTAEARYQRWRTSAFVTWTVIGILLLLYLVFRVIGLLSPAFAPFIIASLVVFVLQGPVRRLEDRGIPRGWAVILGYAAALLLVWIVGLFVVPPLAHQVVDFAATVPNFVERGRQMLIDTQARFSDMVLPDWTRKAVLNVADSASSVVVRLGKSAAQGAVSAGGQVATVIFDLFIGAVVAFWMLKDLPKIRQELDTLAGEKHRTDLDLLLSTVGRMVGGYVRGQTIASLVTATIAGIWFAIARVPFPFVLALVVFILNYVPYVGGFISALTAAILGLFVSPLTAVLGLVIVVVAQNLTDTVVTPRVMSKQVDLHPTLVIFSLLVGGTLLGFWGMIVAIPMAATAKALFVYYWEERTRRQLSSQNGALFRKSSCDDTSDESGCDAEEPGTGAS
jgi:predicted PurR-regulated permease PerM